MSTLDRLRLDGKVAIVTGGAGAIGQVYGRALAEAGAAVALADLDGDGAERAAAALAADGFQATGVRVDITDPASAAAMAEAAVAAHGGVDILVNNAAVMAEIPQVDLLDLPPEWFDRVMRVNVLGAVQCSKAVRAPMAERGGGRIINQVSAGAFMAGGIYGISKLALVSVTAGLARSLGPLGINVNAIAPGLVENEPGMRSLPADHPARAALAAAIPGKKQAPAEDLLGTLLLLASPAGEWINGQTISVDGGWVMRL
ncbi:SDR family oxidoreductase [Actinomadura rugatobispora]|uniref:SDR family oxidoreductase n=1 Tax=Actinomadura rugatobispora TaxID=1994 RepID=A0ABW1A259_9ACTN|nr:SDR family oxidoreductase [Actinomadura rugatobispora]